MATQVRGIVTGTARVPGVTVAVAAVLMIAPTWRDDALLRALAVVGLAVVVGGGIVVGSAPVVRASVAMLVAVGIFVLGALASSAIGAAVTTVAAGVLPLLVLRALGRSVVGDP